MQLIKSFPQDSKITGYKDGKPVYDRKYTSADLRDVVRSQYGNGYIKGYGEEGAVSVEGKTVTVAPGAWMVQGTLCQSDSSVTLDASEGKQSIVVRLDTSDEHRAVYIDAKSGEDFPAPTHEGSVYELVLAHIDGGKVTDTREDSGLCGQSRGAIQPIEVEQAAASAKAAASSQAAASKSQSAAASSAEGAKAAQAEAAKSATAAKESESAAKSSADTATDKASEATQRASDAEAAEGRAQDAANDAESAKTAAQASQAAAAKSASDAKSAIDGIAAKAVTWTAAAPALTAPKAVYVGDSDGNGTLTVSGALTAALKANGLCTVTVTPPSGTDNTFIEPHASATLTDGSMLSISSSAKATKASCIVNVSATQDLAAGTVIRVRLV